MAVIEAIYLSSSQRRTVELVEIMGERHDAAYGTGWSHGYATWRAPDAGGDAGQPRIGP
jgi:hypothetical protein